MKCLHRSSVRVAGFVRKYSNDVRVRFAPSPTGHLHLGGLRTALYNYLFAQAHAGKFIVRIEDTDQTRIVPGASEAIEKDLLWLDIKPEESPLRGGSHGPYIQSQRLKHYKERTEQLIQNGTAYCCFCSDKRLELLRREATKRGAVPRYDNKCRNLSSAEVAEKIEGGHSYCVRFKLESGPDSFVDMVYGNITLDTASVEGDPVILKTDSFPTYHLACVVDDHLMEISHVLRGVEWQISTSKHLQLYRAFGWTPPQFGHFPLLMNPNGTKLSKRQGDISIDHFRKSGIFPEVLLSFVTEFGGGFVREHGKSTVYSLNDLIKQFDITSINTNSCKVDLERLVRLNRMELDHKLQDPSSLSQLCDQLRHLVLMHHGRELSLNSSQLSDARLTHLLQWGLPRMSRLEDFVGAELNYIWCKPPLATLHDLTKDAPQKYADGLLKASMHISKSSEMEKDSLIQTLKDICRTSNINYGVFMKVLRAALSGLKAGPPVGELIATVGTEESVLRLQLAAETLQKLSTSMSNNST